MDRNKQILSLNLKRILKQRGITRPHLASSLNLPYNTVVNWTVGRTYPGSKNLQKLTEFLHIPNSELVESPKMPKNVIISKGYVKLPVLGSIPCGDPNTAIRETNEYKLIPSFEPHQGCFFLRADGHSMEPEIKNKSLVKIHLQHTIENKEIAAVSIDGADATLKQVIKNDRDKIVMFHPLNPRFRDIFPNPDNQCRIIGKAVAVTNSL